MKILFYCFWVAFSLQANAQHYARLDVYLREEMTANHFNGVVLVAHKDNIILEKGYGMADMELGVPVSTDHIFKIGSLTKPITATGVLMLAEGGDLLLNDSICSYIRNCPSSWVPIQISHLINHTSGLQDLFEEIACAPVQETAAEIDKTIARIENLNPVDDPGSIYRYNNFGYTLLAYIMEVVSGVYWEDFLIERMFAPLHLADIRYDDVWAIVNRRVQGYEIEEDRLQNIEYDDHCAYAAGGLRSTATDLFIWNRALHKGRFISLVILQEMFSPNDGKYGYGWQIVTQLDRTLYNHTGGIGGFSSHIAYYPAEELTVIVLSNVQESNTYGIAHELARLYFEH